MKYITEKGTEIKLHEPTIARRTLSFRLNNPRTFDPNKMIKIIDREGLGYITELKFKDKYKHETGEVSHAYDIYFRIPYQEIQDSRLKINKLMVKIENALEKEANINYNGYGRHRREWMSNINF